MVVINMGGRGMSISRAGGSTPISAPDAPTSLASSGGPVFTWHAPSSGPVVASYNLYRRVSGVGSYALIQSGITSTTAMDGTVTITANYDYQVTAVNIAGESSPSGPLTLDGISNGLAHYKGTACYQDGAATVPCTADLDPVALMKDLIGSNNITQTVSGNRLRYDAAKGMAVSEIQSLGIPVLDAPAISWNNKSGSIFFIIEQNTSSLQDGQNRTPLEEPIRSYMSGPDFSVLTGSTNKDSYPTAGFGRLATLEAGGTYQHGTEVIPTSRTLLGYVGGSSSAKLIVNGTVDAIGNATTGATTIASLMAYDVSATQAFPTEAAVKEIIVVNGTSSDGDIAYLQGYAKANGCPFDTTDRIINVGDSIDASFNADLNRGWQRQMGFSATKTEYNCSLGGTTAQVESGTFATKIIPLIRGDRNCIVTLSLGTNDLAAAGRTATQVITDLQTMANAAQAQATCWVVVDGILPRNGIETARQAVRTAMLADFNVPTGIANFWAAKPGITWGGTHYYDVGADATIGAPGVNTSGPYYDSGDQTHLTTLGHTYKAGLLAPCYRSLFGSPPAQTHPNGFTIASGPAFSWNAFAGATSYTLYRSIHNAGSFTAIQAGILTTTAVDATQVAGVSYDYRVTATTGGGETPPSGIASSLVLSYDNFPQVASTNLNGQALVTGGTWLVEAGSAVDNGSNTAKATSVNTIVTTDSTNSTVSCKFTFTFASDANVMWSIIRGTDLNDCVIVQIGGTTSGGSGIYIGKIVSGSFTSLGSSVIPVASGSHSLVLSATGNQVTAILDGGTPLLATPDAYGNSQTKCGFRLFQANDTVAGFEVRTP